MKGTKLLGFTLIELLIVVAIIAILAAIAVPNFLEAQTRAKVSRAKADQRSIATAVEAYTIDYNRAPIGYFELRNYILGDYYKGLGQELGQGYVWSQFTTPVAYMTTVPRSPFQEHGRWQFGTHQYVWRYTDRYHWYEYMSKESPSGVATPRHTPAANKGVKWVLKSFGPTRHWYWGPGDRDGAESLVAAHIHEDDIDEVAWGWPDLVWGYPNAIYDPTNGTVSDGFILRSNMGVH